MANIQPLVDYLKVNRQAREAEAKELTTRVEVINQDYDVSNAAFDNPFLDVPKVEIGNAQNYNRLSKYIPNINNNTFIYIEVLDGLDNPNSIKYYERKIFIESSLPVVKYREITEALWFEVVDDSGFIPQQLVHLSMVYYYNATSNRVIVSNTLDTVFVFPDEFGYDPEHIPEIEDNGTYELDYKDHEGYDNSFGDQALKFFLDPIYKYYVDGLNRQVEVNISRAKGIVNLFPLISGREGRYVLKYVYSDEVFSILGIRFRGTAIKLKFKTLETMMEFLNQTVFDEVNFSSLSGHARLRQYFLDQYIEIVNQRIERDKHSIHDLLRLLYYAPEAFLQHIDSKVLWDVVGTALEGPLTNIGLNKEDIVLVLLKALSQASKTPTDFLTQLLVKKTRNQETYFYALFKKMNTSNFINFNNLIKEVWLQSDYANPGFRVYQVKDASNEETFNGPLFLPYKSDKTLGFYHSNVNISWSKNYTQLRVELETGRLKSIENKGYGYRVVADNIFYDYHPFQPIYIKDVSDQKAAIEFDSIIPASYLKAVEAKSTVANFQTAGEYALDVVSTVSGVGNILKLRHITKLSKLGRVVNYIRKGAAAIDIASGSIGILLKLTGTENTPFAKALNEYMFYLEMLSLSVEATDWIREGLKKSSREVLEHQDDLSKHLDAFGDANKRKILDELHEIAEISKTKRAAKLWDEFKYEDLFNVPPTKKPCFLAGTTVMTSKGLLDIDYVNVGDEVYTYNFKKKTIELKPVLELFVNITDKYINLYTSNDTIQVTGGHRFWIPKKNKWVRASQLEPGVEFMTMDATLEKVTKTKVVKSIEATYNLEVQDNSNYFVGEGKLLVHNANKVSKFASIDIIEVAFYQIVEGIVDGEPKPIYVGQTVQGIDKRFAQHKKDPKKSHWRNKMKDMIPVEVNGSAGPFKMTHYEAAVTEMYEMNLRGGKKGLYNKVHPITKKKFDDIRKLGVFNPCQFYA